MYTVTNFVLGLYLKVLHERSHFFFMETFIKKWFRKFQRFMSFEFICVCGVCVCVSAGREGGRKKGKERGMEGKKERKRKSGREREMRERGGIVLLKARRAYQISRSCS